MGGMSCSNPNSCHPFLLTFGLITVFLMAIYLIRDTFFDNARPRKGPILSTLNTAKPRQPPVSKEPVSSSGAVKYTDEGAHGFKALRYEDTRHGNIKRLEKDNGEGKSKSRVAPTFEIKKPSHPPVCEKADLDCRPASFVGEGPDGFQAVEFNPYTWHGNHEDFKKGNDVGVSQANA